MQHDLTIRASPIHGVGVFALRDIISGEDIGIVIRLGVDKHIGHDVILAKAGFLTRTELGRYINHDDTLPNTATSGEQNGDIHLFAIRYIDADHELTCDYGPAECLLGIANDFRLASPV